MFAAPGDSLWRAHCRQSSAAQEGQVPPATASVRWYQGHPYQKDGPNGPHFQGVPQCLSRFQRPRRGHSIFIAGLIIDDFMKRMGIPAPTRAFSRRRTPSSNPIRIRGDTFCGPGMFIVKTAAVCGTARGASAEPRPVRPEPAAYRGLPREVPEVQ